MPHRFYVPTFSPNESVELQGAEAHHLLHVLRLGVGSAVELFDGRGLAAEAQVVETTRHSAILAVGESHRESTGNGCPVTLACAVPKGERFRWLVEKATELGVARLVPLLTERSVVDPGGGKLDKMRQAVVAAGKQSGRSLLMQIDEPISWKQYLADLAGQTVLLADPDGDPLTPENVLGWLGNSAGVVICIGPEGGWTPAELQTAREHDVQFVSLGQNILRIETAALSVAALFALLRTP